MSRVKRLQEALQKLGYGIGTVDGAFGESTLKAVRDFQKKNNMSVDGVVGKGTFAAILKAKGEESSETEAGPAPAVERWGQARDPGLCSATSCARASSTPRPFPSHDQALALVDKPDKRHWVYYYARGTSYERLKNWPAAEADLGEGLGALSRSAVDPQLPGLLLDRSGPQHEGGDGPHREGGRLEAGRRLHRR